MLKDVLRKLFQAIKQKISQCCKASATEGLPSLECLIFYLCDTNKKVNKAKYFSTFRSDLCVQPVRLHITWEFVFNVGGVGWTIRN